MQPPQQHPYVRPQRGTALPSRHLYAVNVGPSVGVSLADVAEAFRAYGPVECVCEAPGSARVFVSMASVEAAVAAKGRLSSVCGREVRLSFTLREDELVKDRPLPVLRDSQATGIQGLRLYKDFITEDEEKMLLAEVGQREWQHLAKRRVQHYGFEFQYKIRNVDVSESLGVLPEFTHPIADRISQLPELAHCNEPAYPLDQLTVNEYQPGVGLSPHIDTHSAFQGAIVSLSLASNIIMEFREAAAYRSVQDGGTEQSRSSAAMRRRALLLPARSLLVFSGEARYAWQHYIPHRKADWIDGKLQPRESCRVSFTFRKVRHGPCRCAYPAVCDSQLEAGPDATSPNLQSHIQAAPSDKQLVDDTRANGCHGVDEARMGTSDSAEPCTIDDNALAIPAVERKYVHAVYDAIAPHFSDTRFARWPRVLAFLRSLPKDAMVLDAGCGNGKYLGVVPHLFMVGCDYSAGLVDICAGKGFDASVADTTQLPYRDNVFDAVISIAVLHHLSSNTRRTAAVQELLRVVKPGGCVLLTAWSKEQEDANILAKWTPIPKKAEEDSVRSVSGQDFFVPWHVPYHRVGTQQHAEGAAISEEKEAILFKRYYHVFVRGELQSLVQQFAQHVDIVDHYYDKSNWCVIVRKRGAL
eukprot:jgi/Chlat1/4397/Chrsp29S04535